MFPCICQAFLFRYKYGKIVDQNDRIEVRHLRLVQVFPYYVSNKQKFSVRMIDNMVNVICFELMKYGYGYCTVCQCGEKSDCPMASSTMVTKVL